MSVDHSSSFGNGEFSHRGRIWQRDELLLILRTTNRCLPPEDIAKFVDFIEDALPAEIIIRFQGIQEINRQLDQMLKWELIEKKGSCYKITEKGSRLADEAELSVENDETAGETWAALRNALGDLPSTRMKWDSHLYAALKGLKKETGSVN